MSDISFQPNTRGGEESDHAFTVYPPCLGLLSIMLTVLIVNFLLINHAVGFSLVLSFLICFFSLFCLFISFCLSLLVLLVGRVE